MSLLLRSLLRHPIPSSLLPPLPPRPYHTTSYLLVPKKRSIRRRDHPDPLTTLDHNIRKNQRKRATKERRLRDYKIYDNLSNKPVTGESDVFVGKKNEESLFRFMSSDISVAMSSGDSALREGKKRFTRLNDYEDSSSNDFNIEQNYTKPLAPQSHPIPGIQPSSPPPSTPPSTQTSSKRVLRVTSQISKTLNSILNDSRFLSKHGIREGVEIAGVDLSGDLRYGTVVYEGGGGWGEVLERCGREIERELNER